ncbi:HipA domain-containing protein [Arthrobacter alpinus]|nr:HipA domain-containing protein [Arthrobacter alpinus]
MKLQARARIRVQPSSIVSLGVGRSAFLTYRFDRHDGSRIAYMSFKNAFAIQEFENPDYASLARRFTQISASPGQDAAELFTRAAMLAMVNNIDDHMRNHGLLHTKNGWRLSPSFDVNPARQGRSSTPLTPQDDPGNRGIHLLVDAAVEFRLTQGQAVEPINVVNEAVSHGQEDAASCGIDRAEIAFMESAFEGPNRQRADALRPAAGIVIDTNSASGRAASTASGDVWVQPQTRRGKLVEGHFRRRRH